MFVRPLALYAVALACITQVQAAISILEPNSQTTWYKNNTVQMTWGSSAGDPNPFRILLNNSEGVMSTNATLADSVNTDLKGLTILLPQLLDSNGYTIYFVNTSNSTQVYAASQPFIIASGQVPSTAASASGAAASTLTATSANIPGPYTNRKELIPVLTIPLSSPAILRYRCSNRYTVGFGFSL
ncbi:hypothetical protein QFC22_001318 [Naganishia vaughanmartiniae]|uniref:Uncharacterized protein n=1 Tax=Naganishia vaughanmartiniae TaxID=1424756 RepID=A0ACC2XGS8_9TREE|nr:hypothetical protein QFC22_001318 [Naganishia vaughanmartiniae]